MIPFFGMSLGFGIPLALLAAPIVLGVLIYVYRKKGSGKRRTAPSTFLLKTLREEISSRQTFLPPLRFFFELLALLLLSCAAAGLFFQNKGELVAIVVDNSLSMATSVSNQSRLDAAKDDAAYFVRSSSGSARFVIFTTSPQLKQLGGERELDLSEALGFIRDISIGYADDKLEKALEEIVSKSSWDKVHVFTDKHASSESREFGQGVALTTSRLPSTSPLENLAIAGISFENSKEPDSDRISMVVTARSFSHSKILSALQVDSISLGGRPKTIAEKSISLAPNDSARVSFVLPKSESAAFRINISSPQLNDALEYDNYGWAVSSNDSDKVLVVSSLSPNSLGLSKIGQIGFKYASAISEIPAGNELPTIFHRISPEILPDYSSIFILPQQGSPFGGTSLYGPVKLSAWDDSSEILRYMNLRALSVEKGLVLSAPLWAQELIRGHHGPLVAAGERHGSRYAGVGFEILPYRAGESPARSIFTLNLLKWLGDFKVGRGATMVGQRIKVNGQLKSIQVIANLSNSSVPLGTNKREVAIDVPGLYQLITESGTSKYAAVNFFDSEESDVKDSVEIKLPRLRPRELLSSRKNSLVPKLALIVLLLFVADLLLQIFRPIWQARRVS